MDGPWRMTLRNRQYNEEGKEKKIKYSDLQNLIPVFAQGLWGVRLYFLNILFSLVPILDHCYL